MVDQSSGQLNCRADELLLPESWQKKIDVTDVISISNRDFLLTIFGDAAQQAQPVLVSFQESPAKVDKRAWSGAGRQSAEIGNYLFDDGNNFFTVATFHPDTNGFYARRKKQFYELHLIMLDDVGTKVPLERLIIEPTALIETSRGNYQALYALAEPLRDAKLADQLMKAFIKAGLCDPGADGPTARLARLPVGINRKYEPPHKCSLRYWQQHRKHTLEELVAGFGLGEFLNTPRVSKKKTRQPRAASIEPVYVPTAEENSVIASLKAQKLFKMPLGSGKSDITCPWVHEHTDGIDHGTAYFEPDAAHPIGGFNCLHAHCKERTIKDLLDYLKISPSHARGKAQINVDPGEMGNIIDAAERELAKSGRHYQRGGMICIVSTAPETNHTSITPIKASNIRIALSNAASWYKYYPSLEDYVQIDPPAEYAKALFDAPEYRYLPVLRGLSRQPYLRPDGSLTTTPGYDPLTGMFGVFASQEFNIPDAPTISDVQASIKLIELLLEECPFKSTVDHAATLSAILTAAIRCSLPLAPMFHVRAPLVGSGKSFLCRIIGIFSSARLGTPTTFPQEDEECRKLLLAELLTGPAVIEFDNLTTDLVAHKSLCVALTSEYMTDRILGASKTASVSTRTLFLSSGNNVSPTQDMVRRCITIDLDPLCETPATKNYKNPRLIEDILAARGKYVSAALTIIRGWIVAGRPRTECKTLATFTDWVDLCTQPLMWLGYPNPMTSAFEAMANDPDRTAIARFMEIWRGHFGKAPGMIRELVSSAYTNPEILEVLEDIAPDRKGGLNNRSLGRWIKRHAGRIVDGYRFVAADGSRNASAWRLESVE
jgi:hypothetical protein